MNLQPENKGEGVYSLITYNFLHIKGNYAPLQVLYSYSGDSMEMTQFYAKLKEIKCTYTSFLKSKKTLKDLNLIEIYNHDKERIHITEKGKKVWEICLKIAKLLSSKNSIPYLKIHHSIRKKGIHIILGALREYSDFKPQVDITNNLNVNEFDKFHSSKKDVLALQLIEYSLDVEGELLIRLTEMGRQLQDLLEKISQTLLNNKDK